MRRAAAPAPLSRTLVLATAAHDLRNPLSAIFGYAEALLMEPGDHSLSERQRELVNRIRGASLRGLELAKNLQSISEQKSTSKRRLGKSSLLSGIHSAIESVWFPPEKNLKFSLSSSLESTDRVGLEGYEVERLVGNLLSNAIKYSPIGASIELAVKRDGRFATISVSNTGTFIPPRERREIFKVFARGSLSRFAPGSGLGLAIVDHLARRGKGDVKVASSAAGTTFTVQLPTVSANKPGTK